MARLIEKRKNYNTYLRRVVFTGYGLRITMNVEVPTEAHDLTPVNITLDQAALREPVAGLKWPTLFFDWFYVKQFHIKPFEEAVRLIRRLSELCVAADFELLEKDMVRFRMGSTTPIFIAGDISVRAGSVRRVARKLD